MKPATITKIKKELALNSHKELLEICLRLAKFKKENKELLSYLLFDAESETAYIEDVKEEINNQFNQISANSYYLVKKNVRKIQRLTKKHIRYSKEKNTEIELLIYFCECMQSLRPSIKNNNVLLNIYNRQVDAIYKAVSLLHKDLQLDYQLDLEKLLV